jgi:stearoyl-CoA desaturase (delta-9 desaturase)
MIPALFAALMVLSVAIFSTTIYLHRCQTHGALKMHPALEWAFRFALWLTTGQSTAQWVAVHRKHHAFSDVAGDPHSPYIQGFWKVQLLDAWLYIQEAKKPETIAKYAHDIKTSAWDRILFNRGYLGLGIGISLLVLIFGPKWGLIAAATHASLYVGVLTSCVNAIGHQNRIFGIRVPGSYQNYHEDYAEKTHNYTWLSWLTAGEGRHNNHHGDPRSAFFAHFPGETDPSRPIIKFLERMGLVYNVVPPQVEQKQS